MVGTRHPNYPLPYPLGHRRTYRQGSPSPNGIPPPLPFRAPKDVPGRGSKDNEGPSTHACEHTLVTAITEHGGYPPLRVHVCMHRPDLGIATRGEHDHHAAGLRVLTAQACVPRSPISVTSCLSVCEARAGGAEACASPQPRARQLLGRAFGVRVAEGAPRAGSPPVL